MEVPVYNIGNGWADFANVRIVLLLFDASNAQSIFPHKTTNNFFRYYNACTFQACMDATDSAAADSGDTLAEDDILVPVEEDVPSTEEAGDEVSVEDIEEENVSGDAEEDTAAGDTAETTEE